MEVAEVYLDILGRRIKEVLKKIQSSKGGEEEFEEDGEIFIEEDEEDSLGPELEDILPSRKARWKSFLHRMAAPLAIIVANASFLLAGGFIFTSTETEYQETARKQVENFQRQYCSRFQPLYTFKGAEAEEYVIENILNYTMGIYKFLHNMKWDGLPASEPVHQWQFDSAVLYSIVVVTAIGYGDVTPKSINGRLLTVIYAMMGIPVFLMFINVFGKKLGRGFKYLYYHITCTPQKERKMTMMTMSSFSSSEYSKRHMTLEELHFERTKKIRDIVVPFHVSLFVLISYMMLGSAFFYIFDGKWDFFISLYFSFVSLTTIGFGDYVFGKCRGAGCENNDVKLAVTCIYIMFGLGIVSMSFNHMAQSFSLRFSNFRHRFLNARQNNEESKKNDDHEESGQQNEDGKLMYLF